VPVVDSELSLLTTDNEQLLVLSLEQANADGQVEIHAPEFHLTRECAVEGVDDHDHESKDMQSEEGKQQERDIPHLDDGMAPVEPEENACGIEDDGVSDADDNVGYTVAIEILGAEVETAWVEVADHVAEAILIVSRAERHTTGRAGEGQDCSRSCTRISERVH